MQPRAIPLTGEDGVLGARCKRTPARRVGLTIEVEQTSSEVESAELR
ncbi:hypothetical protein [Thiocapsa roseopersicina]|nr:hypothetical protein [Thiocapsa roseopersicina]